MEAGNRMRKEETRTKCLYDLSHTAAKELLERFTYPWEALPHIKEFILALGASLPGDEYEKRGETVWVHRTANVFASAYLGENIIIGKDTEVRHGAFLRGNALIGEGAVVGNSTELKNVILFDKVQVPHYNYVGDSILGYRAHMGAGSITSNVKSDQKPVKVHAEDGDIETGMKKFGAMLGDHVEVGCGSVLNPGTVVGRNSNIYPLSSVRSCVDADSIYKRQGETARRREMPV